MTHIVLTRHGHVEGIAPQRFRGRRDVPLSEDGVVQARALAARIAQQWQVSAIYTSPMRRCMETGAHIGKACGLKPQVLASLNDLDYGSWQWRTHQEVQAEFPHQFEEWFSTPDRVRFVGGDSLQDLAARTADALRDVYTRHPDDTVVLVSHASTNRVLLGQALNQPLSAYWRVAQDPCAINEIEYVASYTRVERMNDVSHLPRSEPTAVHDG